MISRSAVDRYLRRREQGTTKELVTPEGVPLHLTIASLSSRSFAFLLDFGIMLGALILLGIFAFGLGLIGLGGNLAMALIGLGMFLILFFYHVWFEIRWHGSTPGKRILGVRVIDRRGAALTPEAVFARNLTRQVEFFLPLILVLSMWGAQPGSVGLITLLGAAWVFLIALLPVFNRDHLRAGDLVAGTMVVLAPRELLLTDLTENPRGRESRAPAHRFLPEHLGFYGVYELQVLEDILRDVSDGRAHVVIAGKIKAKIGWAGEIIHPTKFLEDFYSAQRAKLEQKMLLGVRKESKEG